MSRDGARIIALAGLALTTSVNGAEQGPEANSVSLSEIVVTAQRRPQSGQDVPISITSLSAEKLAASGVTSLPDIASLTPGLQFTQIGATSVPFLRGVGATSTGVGSESGTALFIDGVYLAAQPLSTMALSNIESIEIDKGPQGTLFGRNATGGVIQITTRKPTHQDSLDATVGYENFRTYEASLYGTHGLTPNLAADISLYAHDQNDGWGRNLYNGGEAFTSYDYGVRSKWLYTPSNATEVMFIAGYEQIRVDSGFETRLPRPGELGQNERSPTGAYQFTGGFYDVALNFPSFSISRTGGVSLSVRQELPIVDFRSISSWQKLSGDYQVDFDLGPYTGSHLSIPPTENTASQEFQFLSKPDSQALFNWVAGTFLFRDESHYNAVTTKLAAQTQRLLSNQITDSWAVFGQSTINLPAATRLTLGARYTSDKRSFDGIVYNTIPTYVVVNQQTGSKTFPKTTFKVALDHRFTPDVLAYVQGSRGFKSGFFSTQSLQPSAIPPANSSVPLAVKPEVLDAYEIGLKSDWLDRRFRANASAFFYNYKDLQVNAFLSSGARVTLNAATAHIKGLDFDFQAALASHLTASLSGSYLDARYVNFLNAPFFTPRTKAPWGSVAAPGDADGNEVINSPKFSGTFALDYSVPVFLGELRMNGTAYYNGGYYFDTQNRLKQTGFTLLGTSVKWVAPSTRWDVSLWGNNLLNKEVLAAANPTGGGDSLTPRPPRTYGVRFGMHF